MNQSRALSPIYDRYLTQNKLKSQLSQEEICTLIVAARGEDEPASRAARERLLALHFRLILSTSKKFAQRHLTAEDLLQEGCAGFLRAIEKFDETRQVPFSAYAILWIRQAMLKAIEDHSLTIRLPSQRHQQLRTLKRFHAHLQLRLGRPPLAEELQEISGISAELIRTLMPMLSDVSSLDSPVRDGESTLLIDLLSDPDALTPETLAQRSSLRDFLHHRVSSLPEREALILKLRFGLYGHRDGEGMTLEAIAPHFGVTRERVRQILHRALRRLSRLLESERQNL